MEELKIIFQIINTGGVIGALVVFVFGLLRGWWIMRAHYKEVFDDLKKQLAEMKEDRDKWQDTALRGTDLAERSIGVIPSVSGQKKLEAKILELEARIQRGDPSG